MSLNGIDTASYQAGLDYTKVPMDFAIIKATQGTGYINPDFARSIRQAEDAGKLLGIYHYAAGGDAKAEADHFMKVSADYIEKAILCLDWEGEQNPQFGRSDVKWCKAFCDRVKEKTGVSCFLYMSKSVCRAHDWSPLAANHPLWCAQYASMGPTGYQASPWTDEGTFGAWASPLIYQYSSGGQLAGWSGWLDLDIAYISREEWEGYARGDSKPAVIEFPEKTDTDLAIEILFNIHGTGDARKKALGRRYSGAQADVNRLLDGNKTSLLMAIQSYIKRHGCGEIT